MFKRRLYFHLHAFKDFGDGGSFPEIHVAQFPLGMGKSGERKGASNTLALTLDAQGKVQYDAIVKHGHSADKVSNQLNRLFKQLDKSLLYFLDNLLKIE